MFFFHIEVEMDNREPATNTTTGESPQQKQPREHANLQTCKYDRRRSKPT